MTLKCEIKLADPNGNGVLYAGQILTGDIIINLAEVYTVKSISVQITGEAQCKWTEKSRNVSAPVNTNTSRTVLYMGSETYLNSKTFVVPKSCNDADINLAPGLHVYNFACPLPNDVPPSIESSLGYIRYQIVVTIERSPSIEKHYRIQFNVLIPLDLNNFDEIARHPKVMEKIFKFYNCIAATNPLELRISLLRTGYAIGEVLPINVDANNLTNVDIKLLRFSLLQNILYHSDTPWRNSRLVTKHKVKVKSGVLKKSTHVNFQQYITIPFLPVTDDSSRVICVSYDLEIMVVAKGFHTKKKMLIPIIIGNVPICTDGPCEERKVIL